MTSLFLYRYSLLVHMVSAASLAKCQIAVYPSLLATTTPNQVPSVTFILIDIVISICNLYGLVNIIIFATVITSRDYLW